jgi:hypothetical protein
MKEVHILWGCEPMSGRFMIGQRELDSMEGISWFVKTWPIGLSSNSKKLVEEYLSLSFNSFYYNKSYSSRNYLDFWLYEKNKTAFLLWSTQANFSLSFPILTILTLSIKFLLLCNPASMVTGRGHVQRAK